MHKLYALLLTSTSHIVWALLLHCSSDILKSVITRTKALMLHIQDRWIQSVTVADLYDSFQDQSTELLSEDHLSYVQIQKFMPILLQLWDFSELKTLNNQKVETDIIAEK
jgi:hypothetical protein